jgi:serine/threonine-protein kinase
VHGDLADPQGRLSAALADRYHIERELGEGGMATVFLAEDIKHHRKVAIKVLHAELSAILGPERFLKEIELTASLQHPHILPLFDSGSADGLLFYVMPYVDGETLRARLDRDKQLPIADAVRIATEAADALAYAHGRGVVHRDIKPENILLQNGHALVADFGIALAVQQAGGQRMTQTGLSLGTPQYMSPEQAMGEREIGPRSDIYSLGAVTYEMLSGDPPFTGSSAQAIVAQVITGAPRSLVAQRKSVPLNVDDAVMTAIEKLPADRFDTASDFAAALVGNQNVVTTKSRVRSAAQGPHLWRRVSGMLGALSLVLLALTGWALTRRTSASAPQVFDAALPDSATMTFAPPTTKSAYGFAIRNLSIAPSGDFAVYAASHGDSTQLWYRSLRDATAHVIVGTNGGTVPRISPDGAHIAFLMGDAVMIVPTGGGAAHRLLAGESPASLEWTAPSTLAVVDEDGDRISWIDANGGVQRALKTTGAGRCVFGRPLDASGQLLCPVEGGVSEVKFGTAKRSEIRQIRADGSVGGPLTGTGFRLVDRAYLVYIARDGELKGARYDSTRHLVSGVVSLVSGVRRETVGEGQFDIAADGTLVYAPGADGTVGRLVRIDHTGTVTPLPVPAAAFLRFDLSRDRRWLAAVVEGDVDQELHVHDLKTGEQFTWLHADLIRHALWNPTGDRLVVAVRDSTRWSLLFGAPGSGASPDTIFTTGPEQAIDPSDFPADTMVFGLLTAGSVTLRFNPASRHARLDTVNANGYFSSLSPDGKRLLYEDIYGQSVETTSYPVSGRRWRIASDAVEPIWLAPDQVLYRSGVSWYLARLDPATGEPAGAPTLWATDARFADTPGWSNRLSHDGGIIYLEGPAQKTAEYLRVIPNWVAQMKAAVQNAK